MLSADLERVRALYDKIKLDCLPSSWAAERLGVGSERLSAWRRDGEAFGLPLPADMLYDCVYPMWQFDLDTGRPYRGLERVILEAHRLDLDAVDLYLALTRRPGLAVKGEAATSCLRGGDIERALSCLHQAAEGKALRASA